MIKSCEFSAKTESDAIKAALAELKLPRDEISVEILERAKPGFLGFGKTDAKIRVTYEVPDPKPVEKPAEKKPVEKPAEKKPVEKKPAEKPAEKKPVEKKPAEKPAEKKPAEKKPAEKPAKPVEKKPVEKKPVEKKPAEKKPAEKQPKAIEKAAEKPVEAVTEAPVDMSAKFEEIRAFLTGLLQRMNIEADIDISLRDSKGINVNLSGPHMGSVIGRRGETLDAIQHLTNYVVNRGNEKHMHISVDAESYRAKREESLVHLAEKMAEKVIKYKRSMALEPMNSYERHIIHTALQDYEGVTTSSTGTEPNRRVVVSYDRPQPVDNKPKSREWA